MILFISFIYFKQILQKDGKGSIFSSASFTYHVLFMLSHLNCMMTPQVGIINSTLQSGKSRPGNIQWLCPNPLELTGEEPRFEARRIYQALTLAQTFS